MSCCHSVPVSRTFQRIPRGSFLHFIPAGRSDNGEHVKWFQIAELMAGLTWLAADRQGRGVVVRLQLLCFLAAVKWQAASFSSAQPCQPPLPRQCEFRENQSRSTPRPPTLPAPPRLACTRPAAALLSGNELKSALITTPGPGGNSKINIR